jgi:flagellar hook-associated protein 3 FlgL
VTRITQSMVSRNLLADLNDVTNRIANTQRKLSSGKELNMPSDDPFAVSRAAPAPRRRGAVPPVRA